eukprot:scaffold39028_cov65-Phaeocystis_antarctica.AAC.1
MEGIFPRSAPRIEHDPNLEAATAHVAINPVTGASAEPLLGRADGLRSASKGGGEKDGAGPPTSLGAVSRADNVADVAVVQPRVVPHRAQEAVNSRPQGPGGERQRQAPYQAPAHWRAHRQTGCFPSCGQSPGSLDNQGSGTPRQQALHVARQCMQISRTDAEIYTIARTLSLALGSARTESATIKAVHAVLLHLDRPGMSKKEAYTSTGASMSTFKKWQRRAQYAQLDLPPPAEQKTAAVNRSVQIGG